MAFCNSCGATVEGGAKLCPKCGKPVLGAVPDSTVTQVAPAQNSNALKIILIVVAVVIGLGLLAAMSTAFVAWRIARHSHIENNGGNVRVETPFGSVVSTDDASEAVRNLGIDLYPGARPLKGNAASLRIGGMHTVAAEFESDDPAEKVGEFYKSRMPDAQVSVSDGDHYNIVSTDKKNVVTINIEPQDGKTRIHIATVSGKKVGSSSSSY